MLRGTHLRKLFDVCNTEVIFHSYKLAVSGSSQLELSHAEMEGTGRGDVVRGKGGDVYH